MKNVFAFSYKTILHDKYSYVIMHNMNQRLLSYATKENIEWTVRQVQKLSFGQLIGVAILVLISVLGYATISDPSILKEIMARQSLRYAYEMTVETTPKVNHELKMLREELEATNSVYVRYHNGTSSGGFPFLYKSVVTQVSAEGFITNLELASPLSASADIDQLVYHVNDTCQFRTVGVDKIAFEAILIRDGMKQLATCPILSDNLLVGYVAIGWNYTKVSVNSPQYDRESTKLLDKIKTTATAIEYIHYVGN